MQQIKTNPFREAAKEARAYADKLNDRPDPMAEAFPLGAGFGRGSTKSRGQRIDARINHATKAVAAERKARGLEALADAFDRGEVNERGKRPNAAREARAAKRRAQEESKRARIAEAEAMIEGKDPLDVDPETWATARGYLGGPARAMVVSQHAERIAAKRAAKDDVFGMLGDIFRPTF